MRARPRRAPGNPLSRFARARAAVMTKTIRLLPIALAALLAACGVPVPPDKSAYVGEWGSPHMVLRITQDGHVDYERHEGATSKSVSGPLKGFVGDSFEVGIGPMSTTFEVTAPPHVDGDKTLMTVDGVQLEKR